MVPVSRTDDSAPAFLPAAFTAVSAVCVTGLTPVDPATYWTPFGQGVILALIQIGGFGIMTLATLLSLMVAGRLGLRNMMVVQSESHSVNLGDARTVLRRVAVTMALFETALAVVLTARFRVAYDDNWADALWHGIFHAVSAFNNAGFALYSDNIIGFVTDPWICVPLSVGVIAGGLGFPVLAELHQRARRPAYWTMHTRLTVYGSLLLLVVGTGVVLIFEWSNQGTLGDLSVGGRIVAAVTGGVMPRTAGFNSIDYGAITPETLVFTDGLMFIGGGSAGTAGGIKVATFFLLAFVIWAEIRGEADVKVGHRSISAATQRQALSVALLGVGVVALGTVTILVLSEYSLDVVLFESISAFATVGLTTGITADLAAPAQVVLMTLMFVGRVGTITVATALALKTRHRHYQLPEERPIIG
ncbi:MAG: TrkH family potassium uptake protein [Nocardioidaceae bacterium]|nr:TrkH family potassium uptake protein [Nocardioidaceae bacterium]